MYFKAHEIPNLIAALQDDRITVAEAVRACEDDPRSFVTHALIILNDPKFGSPAFHPGASKTLELIWRLTSVKSFMIMSWPTHIRDLACKMISAQLHQNPDLFSDDDLHYMTLTRPFGDEISTYASNIQTSRITKRVRRINQQPRELSLDVKEVQRQVSLYNFDPDLNLILDKVEVALGSGDAFDQSATLKHLRTFFEKLHAHVGEKLRQSKPETVDRTPLDQCQMAIDYLQRKGVVTDKMQMLGRALYGVLSNEGVHAIKSDREYVRLCRNMVAEYALVLFFELSRRLAN
jgi:hypothetical protein